MKWRLFGMLKKLSDKSGDFGAKAWRHGLSAIWQHWAEGISRREVNIFLNFFQVQCCPDRIFPCLQCHNETSNHKAQEKAIQALVCQYCNNVQRDIINHCVQCNNQFSQVRLLIEWSTHSLLKVKISAHQPKVFAKKCLISIKWIVINENIGLLGHLKTMPIPLML